MPLAVFRGIAVAVFVVGIAGMIAGSIADNNNGVVVTFGLLTAASALVLMAVAYTTRVLTEQRGGRRSVAPAVAGPITPSSAGPVDEELAAGVEAQVESLVASGADEGALRRLVGDAVRLGRSAREVR